MKVQLTKDFAGHKSGKVLDLDSLIATSLVNRKIAKKPSKKKK